MVLKWINIFAFEFQKAEVKSYLGLQVPILTFYQG